MSATSPNPTQFATSQPGGSGDHTAHDKIAWGPGTGASGVVNQIDDVLGARLPVGGALIGTPSDTSAVASLLGRLLKLSEQLPSTLTPGGNLRNEIMVDNSGVPTGQVAMASSVPVTTSTNQKPGFPDNSFLWTIKFAEVDGPASNFVMHTATGGRRPVATGYQICVSEACTVPVRVFLGLTSGSLPSLGSLQSNIVFESAKLAPGTVIDVNANRLATGNVGDSVKLTTETSTGGHVTVTIRGFEELP